MQTVSQAYKTSMKSPLRNRGYIQVNFGIFDEAVQRSANFDDTAGVYAWYSDDSDIFGNQTDEYVYATLENNFFKVDGSQYFLPKPGSNYTPRNTGIVSNNLVNSPNTVTMTITLDSAATWYGLTINFGENYPTSFDINYGDQTLEVRDNASPIYVADQAFTNVDELEFVFRAMRYSNERVRIYNVRFGIGYVFGNDSIMDSSLTRVISPISEFLPQFDFTVTLKNYDRYFDVNNPNSALNFLSTNSTCTVQYGYELYDGTIEWVPGQTLLCSEWTSDNKVAILRCQDVLRNLDSEYPGGTFDADGKTYAQLAAEVLTSAGITNYYLDPVLSEKITRLPVPNVSHKEALQMIANACCCIMTFARDGSVQILSTPTAITFGTFRMQKRDMTSYPMAQKLDPVKDVVIDYQQWRKNGTETNILSEEITVAAYEEKTYRFAEPIYDYRLVLEGIDVTSTAIIDSGDYYITVKFPFGGTTAVDIYGKPYTIVKQSYTHNVSNKGKTVIWSNPLVDRFGVAAYLAIWLGNNYSGQIEYEYDTRGNPELDVGDLIWQDDLYNPVLKVLVTEYRLDFQQAFSGRAVTKRIGGS